MRPGRIYVAPGDFHMLPERRAEGIVLRLNQDPPENFCRPAVDPMFRAAANAWGAGALAVMLTGTGQDGLAGSRIQKRAPIVAPLPPLRFSAQIMPRCASTICFEIESPSPECVPNFSPSGRSV